jgi:hypothetical protein
MRTWKEQAAEAVKAGYMPKNHWERMLERHLRRLFPQLVQELGDDLEAYLVVMTYDAMNLANRLEDEGTDPHTARELALEQLLPKAPDEEDRPEPWEVEGGIASMEAAAERALERWQPPL